MTKYVAKTLTLITASILMAAPAMAESAVKTVTATPVTQAKNLPIKSFVPFGGALDLNRSHLLKRGIQNYLDGDYSMASILFHRAGLDPSGNIYHAGLSNYYMGLTKAKIGNNRAAVRYLKQANAIFRNAPHTYAALGTAYAELGQDDKARRVLARLGTVPTCDVNCASTAEISAAKTIIEAALAQ